MVPVKIKLQTIRITCAKAHSCDPSTPWVALYMYNSSIKACYLRSPHMNICSGEFRRQGTDSIRHASLCPSFSFRAVKVLGCMKMGSSLSGRPSCVPLFKVLEVSVRRESEFMHISGLFFNSDLRCCVLIDLIHRVGRMSSALQINQVRSGTTKLPDVSLYPPQCCLSARHV